MMLTGRPATISEIRRVHPDHSCSYRAWACDMDGRIVGIVGVALTRPYACLFCWFDEALRPHLKSLTVMRLLKKVADVVRDSRVPVLAIRDRNEPKAPHILKRMGFRFYQLVEGDAVYRSIGQ